MLYKPYAAAPNLNTISVKSNDIVKFTVQGMGSSPIHSIVRLGLTGSITQTTLDTDNFYYSIEDVLNEITPDGYIVNLTKNQSNFNKNTPMGWKVRLYEAQSFMEDDGENEYPFIQDMNNPRKGDFNYELAYNDAYNYSTSTTNNPKTRIYSDEMYYCTAYIPTSCIGYGTIGQYVSETNHTHTVSNLYIYKGSNYYHCSITAAHGRSNTAYSDGYKIIRIFPHAFHGSKMVGDNSLTYSDLQKYIEGYDDYLARYYIKIKGRYYKILDWRYYDWRYANETDYDNQEKESYMKGDTAGWRDGYGNPLSMYVLIKAPDLSITTDTDYSIYCNYIDTDNYSFQINDVPEITFSDSKFPDNPITFYDSKDEALKNPFILNYSNFELTGSYNQNSGAYISQYQATLSFENGNIIDKTKKIFSQNIKYNYDEFANDKKYILHISITNDRNITDERYLYIQPQYEKESNLIKADVKFHPKNDSVVLDFSKLFSISPTISEKGYTFDSQNNSVKILDGNTLTYDKLDDTNETLKITSPLLNFTFTTKELFEEKIAFFTDDYNNEYTFDWNGITFNFVKTGKDSSTLKLSYSPYKDRSFSGMLAKMKTSKSNIEVCYYWDDNFSNTAYDSSLYFHTETPAETYWWSVIITDTAFFIKNISVESDEWHKGE